MHHRPGGFGGGAGKHTLAAGHSGFVAGGAVGFTGLEDEGGLAVEADIFGNGFGVAQVGEEREGDGCDRRSRRGRPTEIGEDKDDSKVAVFAGDFIECHGGLLLLGMGASENFSDDLTGALELGKVYVLYLVSLIFIFPGEIPSSDSTKSSSFSTFFFEKGVWHKGGCNFK